MLLCVVCIYFFFSSRRRHTRCALVTGAQTCALPICIGITSEAVVHTPGEAVRYLTRLREMLPGRPILIQEYLTGTEYSVGIVGNPGQGYHVLPLLEVDYSGLDPALPPIL